MLEATRNTKGLMYSEVCARVTLTVYSSSCVVYLEFLLVIFKIFFVVFSCFHLCAVAGYILNGKFFLEKLIISLNMFPLKHHPNSHKPSGKIK